MFGYVRPFRDELKCREFDYYRAAYCGLCRAMRQRHGWLAPMLLNYDFTFLALLLEENGEDCPVCRGRCHVNPLRKLPMCSMSPALALAADESMVLAYWKLRDSAQDDEGWKGLAARLLCGLFQSAYRKAAKGCPEFDRTVRDCLAELHELEGENCPSMDRVADTFARLLQGAAPITGLPERDRPVSLLLYHIGRWIYLADARDDLEEDRRTGAYNPLLLRFEGECDDALLATTMKHSLNMACSALAMLDLGKRGGILENILYLGLPAVQKCIFDGSWAEIKKQKIWRRTNERSV